MSAPKQATKTVGEHHIEFRPYKGQSGAFVITVSHQVQLLIDGVFVGYCPSHRGHVFTVGQVPDEIAEAIAKAAGEYWDDQGGEASVAQAQILDDEKDT